VKSPLLLVTRETNEYQKTAYHGES